MDEPKIVLSPWTLVITNDNVVQEHSFLINKSRNNVRRPGALGLLRGFLSGHGGDVYWVQHQDGTVGPYGWWEFDYPDKRALIEPARLNLAFLSQILTSELSPDIVTEIAEGPAAIKYLSFLGLAALTDQLLSLSRASEKREE